MSEQALLGLVRLRLGQERFDLALAVDGDAVFLQKRRRYAVSGCQAAGERAVVNAPAAAARAALLQNVTIDGSDEDKAFEELQTQFRENA